MPRTRIRFPNAQGHQIDGVLAQPDGPPRAYAIYAHCFTCTKEIAAAVRVTKALASHGVATFRCDFAGLGKSEGDFSQQTFSSNVSDLVHAANHIATHYEAPKLLVGHSLGGATVLAGACQIDSIRAVATIGAPATPKHVQHLFEAEVEKIRRQGRAEVQLAGRPFTITKEFVDDSAQFNIGERIRDLKAALLILHSPDDRTVSIDEAAKLYWAALHPKSFIALAGADHLLTKQADAEYAAQLIDAWSSRYIST